MLGSFAAQGQRGTSRACAMIRSLNKEEATSRQSTHCRVLCASASDRSRYDRETVAVLARDQMTQHFGFAEIELSNAVASRFRDVEASAIG